MQKEFKLFIGSDGPRFDQFLASLLVADGGSGVLLGSGVVLRVDGIQRKSSEKVVSAWIIRGRLEDGTRVIGTIKYPSGQGYFQTDLEHKSLGLTA